MARHRLRPIFSFAAALAVVSVSGCQTDRCHRCDSTHNTAPQYTLAPEYSPMPPAEMVAPYPEYIDSQQPTVAPEYQQYDQAQPEAEFPPAPESAPPTEDNSSAARATGFLRTVGGRIRNVFRPRPY